MPLYEKLILYMAFLAVCSDLHTEKNSKLRYPNLLGDGIVISDKHRWMERDTAVYSRSLGAVDSAYDFVFFFGCWAQVILSCFLHWGQ